MRKNKSPRLAGASRMDLMARLSEYDDETETTLLSEVLSAKKFAKTAASESHSCGKLLDRLEIQIDKIVDCAESRHGYSMIELELAATLIFGIGIVVGFLISTL